MPDEMGTLHSPGPTLRFVRVYDHPVHRVWAAISRPEHQAVWFPHQILGDRAEGAPLRFVTSVDPEDGFDGTMIAYDPPRVMEFWWGPSRLRIELVALGEQTRLTLTETLDDLGAGARNGAGWHECLDRLTALVKGTVPPVWGHRWHQVHPAYVAAFGPRANVLKAPQGWDRDLPDEPYAPRFPRHPTPTERRPDRDR